MAFLSAKIQFLKNGVACNGITKSLAGLSPSEAVLGHIEARQRPHTGDDIGKGSNTCNSILEKSFGATQMHIPVVSVA
jgi:hypothetical protein